MYSKLRGGGGGGGGGGVELENTRFKTNYHLFIELSKVLEVANFRFLADFRFLILSP